MISPQGSESIKLESHHKRLYIYHTGRLRDKLGLRYCSIKRVGYVQPWARYTQVVLRKSKELCWAYQELQDSEGLGTQDFKMSLELRML